MKVSLRETIEIDAARKYDVFAYAGLHGVYQHGMTFRDCVKALMAAQGTSWMQNIIEAYPKPGQPRRNSAPAATKPPVSGSGT